jgi:hypothetical protein
MAGVLLVVAVPAIASGTLGARPQSPKVYAKDVCTAIGDWSAQLQHAVDIVSVDASSSAADVKTALAKVLKTAARDTSNLRSQLRKAGAPSGVKGKRIATALQDGFLKVAAALRHARTALKRAATTDPAAFATAASAAGTALVIALEKARATLGKAGELAAGKLLKAFHTELACTKLAKI